MSLQTGLLPRSYFVSRRSAATTPLSEPRLSRSHAQADGASDYHHGQTHARRSREVRSAIVARATEARRRRPHWSRGIPGGAMAPLLVDYYFCSATSRAAAPLVVDDHLGSAASRAAAPLIVDDHLGSATSRAAAPPHRRRPFQLGHRRGDGTIVAGTAHPSPALQVQYRPTTTTPLWRRRSAARRQGRRFTFKPGTDPTPPSLRRHRSATRRRGRRFTFKSGTDPPLPPSQDAAGPTTLKSCVEPES